MVFLLVFKRFKGSQGERNPHWCFEVFLGIFEKTKEKKDSWGAANGGLRDGGLSKSKDI